MENNKLEQSIAGGHEERFSIDQNHTDDSILIKHTNQWELTAYKTVFTDDENCPRNGSDLIFRKFLPKFYGQVETETEEIKIKFENLLSGKVYASVLDLKMGTSTITFNTKPHRVDHVHIKDAKTTSKKLGFRVTGYVIKAANGEIQEKVYKPFEKASEESIPEIIKRILTSNGKPDINREALAFFKTRA